MLETETFADFDDLGDPEHDAPHASDIKACDELLARLRGHHSPNGRTARPATPAPIKLVAATPRPQGDPNRAVALTPDEVLIGRIANGDRLAMQVLFARYHVRVFRFVVRLVRDDATAEDVISEVFLDVWRQAGRFEGRSTVSTWLLAIARFKAISALRRRPDEELDEEAVAAIEDLSDDPATVLEKKDKSAMLRKCLAGLSAEHREIIDLVYYHEKSVKEAAEIVGIPENTVKTRMFHARKRLAELLKSEGIERGWP